MNKKRLTLFGVAGCGLLAAFFLVRGSHEPPPPPAPVIVEKSVGPDPTKVVDILVVKTPVAIGAKLNPSNVEWRSWPRTSLPRDALRRDQNPDALAQITGTMARGDFVDSEVLTEKRIVRANDTSGYVAAMLPEGMRAIAIKLEPGGTSSAGGFILPNDRVDILATANGPAQTGTNPTTVMLRNMKVIAINQIVGAQTGDKPPAILGSTATLLVTQEQAILLTNAERVNRLSLTLRSMADNTEPAPERVAQREPEQKEKTQVVEMIRYGLQGGGR